MQQEFHLGRHIKKELQSKGIPISRIAEQCGTKVSTLYQHMDNDKLTAKELLYMSGLIYIDNNQLRKHLFSRN